MGSVLLCVFEYAEHDLVCLCVCVRACVFLCLCVCVCVCCAEHNKQKGSVHMVFEYAEHDLAGLMMKPSVELGKAVVKHFMKQVLCRAFFI